MARALENDLARLDDIAIIGDLQREEGVLLDEQHRHALFADFDDRVENLLHEDRSKSHARFVKEQNSRVRHKPAADRQHLLLASRQRAGDLAKTLLEDREHVEDMGLLVGDPFLVVVEKCPDLKVLGHREPAENTPAFRHLDDALGHDRMRRKIPQRLAVERHGSLGGGENSRRSRAVSCSCPRHWPRSA